MKKIFTLSLSLFILLSAGTQLSGQINDQSPYPIDVKILSPANIAGSYTYGTYAAGTTPWGPELDRDLEGEPVWVESGAVDIDLNPLGFTDSLGCSTVMNPDEIAGKIALIRRGNCSFSRKAYEAQLAGAIGVVIVNHYTGAGNDENTVVGMSPTVADSSAAVTIPGVFLNRATAELLVPEVDAGNAPIVKFDLLNQYNPLGAYAYSTPQSQIIPLDEISINFFNDSEFNLVNADFTVDITDPSGVVTSFTESKEVTPVSDSVVRFPDYIPNEIGTYSMRFTNTFNTEENTIGFEITENTFGHDQGAPYGTISIGDDNFVDTDAAAGGANFSFDHGSAFLTGPNAGSTNSITFGLNNGYLLATGDANVDFFSIVLMDLDVDNDGFPDGTQDSYDNFGQNALVDFTSYELTGEEGENSLLCASFLSPLQLKPNHLYMVMVQYNGTNAAPINGGVAPVYLTSGNQPTPYFSTTVKSDRLYMAGWGSDANGVIRMHLDGFTCESELGPIPVNATEILDNVKINVYPNPASDVVNLDLNLEKNADEVMVTMHDLSGKQLKAYFFQNVKERTLEFDVNKLESGSYFLRVETPEGTRARKFTVIK